MKKHIIMLFCVFVTVSAVLLAGCGLIQLSDDGPVETKHSEIGPMDTMVNMTIYSEDEETGEDAVNLVLDKIASLENELSHHVTGSSADMVNENAGLQPAQVSSHVFSVVKLGVKYGEITEGTFDITVAPIMRLWRFGEADVGIPEQDELEEKLKLVDFRQVELNEEESTVFLSRPGMALDLGGVAKGYIVDQGIETLRELGVSGAYLDGGGDIRVLGTKPDGSPWRIGIRHPRIPNDVLAVISLSEDAAIVTSGDYQRFFTEDGVRYHHIIDPNTGYPAQTGVISATVQAPDAVTADILSTAFLILGTEKSLELTESLPGIDVVIIEEDSEEELNIHVSSGFKDRIEYLE